MFNPTSMLLCLSNCCSSADSLLYITYVTERTSASVAQSVERRSHNPKVARSSPVRSMDFFFFNERRTEGEKRTLKREEEHGQKHATPTEQVSGEYRPQKPGFVKSTNQKRKISAQFRNPRRSTRKTEEINGKHTLNTTTKGDIGRKTQRGHCPTNFPSRFPPRNVPQFL